MDLTHWPTTSLGRCNRHEQSSWIPEYSIDPGPSLPPPCHSLNAKEHWRKKIGYRKYARALSESCEPCTGPPFLPSVALITRNYERIAWTKNAQPWPHQQSPTVVAKPHSQECPHTTLDTVTRLSQTAHIEKPVIGGVLVFYVVAQSLGKSPDFCSWGAFTTFTLGISTAISSHCPENTQLQRAQPQHSHRKPQENGHLHLRPQ